MGTREQGWSGWGGGLRDATCLRRSCGRVVNAELIPRLRDRYADGEIVFLHGLESGPGGTKARWLRERLGAFTPDLDTSVAIAAWRRAEAAGREVTAAELEEGFAVPLERARVAVERARVVIGSSFGGAVLLQLMWSGAWTGPAVMLAGAGVKLTRFDTLPPGSRVVLVHGRDDTVVDPADSRQLARSPGSRTWLWEVPDEHRLTSVLDSGLLAAALSLVG